MPFLASARKKFMAYMSTPNHYYVEVYAKEGVTARDAMEREGAWVRTAPANVSMVSMLKDNWHVTSDEDYSIEVFVYSQDKVDADGVPEPGAIAICWRAGASRTWNYGTFDPPNSDVYFNNREVMKLNILTMPIPLGKCNRTYEEAFHLGFYVVYPRRNMTLQDYEEAVRSWLCSDGEDELWPFFAEVWHKHYVPFLTASGYRAY